MAKIRSKRVKTPNGAGSVIQRSDGRWMARYTATDPESGEPLRKALYGRTEQEARTKLVEALKARNDGSLVVTRGRAKTVADAATEWLARLSKLVAEGQRSPRTVNRYREIVDQYIEPLIGGRALVQLQPGHVDLVMDTAAKRGRKPRTINYCRHTMRAILNFAMRQGWVNRNVAMMTEPRTQEKPEVKPLPPEQLSLVLSDALKSRDGRLFLTSVSLGTRQSELLGLTWDLIDDLEEREPQVHIRRTLQWDEKLKTFVVLPCKTPKSRRDINLPAIAIEALRRQRQAQNRTRLTVGPAWSTEFGDLVFSGPRGEPLRRTMISKRWTRRLKNLKIPHTSFHGGTRHGAASLLAAQGVPMIEVSRTLGHANWTTTADLYTALFDEARKNVASAMDRALGAHETSA